MPELKGKVERLIEEREQDLSEQPESETIEKKKANYHAKFANLQKPSRDAMSRKRKTTRARKWKMYSSRKSQTNRKISQRKNPGKVIATTIRSVKWSTLRGSLRSPQHKDKLRAEKLPLCGLASNELF